MPASWTSRPPGNSENPLVFPLYNELHSSGGMCSLMSAATTTLVITS